MKKLLYLIFYSFICTSFYAQSIPADSLYLGQTPPGDSAVVFAPGIISLPGRNESCITFSPDGKYIFFSIEFYPSPYTPYIMFTEYKNNKWSHPDSASFSRNRLTNEPFFAFDGTRLYLDANFAVNQVSSVDLCYVYKNDSVWSTPVSMGNPPNSSQDQFHPCIVGDTSIYFSTGSGLIARSQYVNGVYQQRIILPYPVNYANSTQTWGDPFAAPDESYLIFKSTRPGGLGQNDIYISYKKPDGSWTNPKNAGSKINTQYDETSGDITPDGLYMTFGTNKDLRWVSTDFINRLKYTNYVPYLKNQIPNQTDTAGRQYLYTIPDSTFIDDDGNNTLTYSATLSNGSPLPAWLSFDPFTRTFSGHISSVQSINIKVNASDTANASASCTFTLNIVQQIGLEPINEQIPTEYRLLQNYPNPFNPTTRISFDIPKRSLAVLKLYDPAGREAATLVNELLNPGEYCVNLNAGNLCSGVYFYRLEVRQAGSMSGNFVQTRKMILIK